jgi:hypothetical protein
VIFDNNCFMANRDRKRPHTKEITENASIETIRRFVKLYGPWHYLDLYQVAIL